MNIALGSDHAGFELKEKVKEKLVQEGHTVDDVGTHVSDPPVATAAIARLVARKVLDNEAERGILICGTGGGISIAANRFPGIRALLCFDRFTAVREDHRHRLVAVALTDVSDSVVDFDVLTGSDV